jgi:hypothetical protein
VGILNGAALSRNASFLISRHFRDDLDAFLKSKARYPLHLQKVDQGQMQKSDLEAVNVRILPLSLSRASDPRDGQKVSHLRLFVASEPRAIPPSTDTRRFSVGQDMVLLRRERLDRG